MCGFAGFLNLTSKSFSIEKSIVHALQEKLSHRGPDGSGFWQNAAHEIALVHRRLSIMDLTDAGAQPMLDQDNQIVLCVNGEIYNYRELRKELERYGHAFNSQSDSEVILHGYKQWGIDSLLKRLEGMFAWVLYDLRTRELFLVRDRMGVKPIYFTLQQNIISFASEIKALWALPWMQKKNRLDAAYHYLTYLATPAPMTIFEGVYKIPAGYYIRIDAHKEMHIKRWYNLAQRIASSAQPMLKDEQQHIDEIRCLLRNAVKQRMMSDVPVGAFLSGGIDSSLNVALMSEHASTQIHTFTVAFSDGPEYNELAQARQIAQQFNTKHHELLIDESDAFNFFQKMIYHQDEPLGDSVCIPFYFVAKLAKEQGVSVVQVGEGSDELFCGYQQYANFLDISRAWYMGQNYLPQFAKTGMFYVAQKLFPTKTAKLDMLRNWSRNKQFFYGGAVVCSEYMKEQQLKCRYMPVHDPMIEKFFPNMLLTNSYAMPDWHRAELLKFVPQADEAFRMSYIEFMQRLPELLLMRVDKMSMATAVEAREPFLDYRLVEYVLKMPMHFKYCNGVTKYILKKAAQGIIPDAVIFRKKMGFAAPTTRWFKNGILFNDYFNDLLLTKKNAWQDLLNFDAITAMQKTNKVDAHLDYSYQLWAIQNLLALE